MFRKTPPQEKPFVSTPTPFPIIGQSEFAAFFRSQLALLQLHLFSEWIGFHAKQKIDVHVDLISSSREKVEADQRKSFQRKRNVGRA